MMIVRYATIIQTSDACHLSIWCACARYLSCFDESVPFIGKNCFYRARHRTCIGTSIEHSQTPLEQR